MSKEEFLQRLRQALTGEVPQGVIQENIRYYDEYIGGEVRRGLAEETVTGEIGDPRLIAKTIIEATAGAEGQRSYTSSSAEGSYGGAGQAFKGEEQRSGGAPWYSKLLSIIMVVVIMCLVISVIAGLFSLLIPLLGPILIVMFVMWLVRGRR